MNSHQSSVITDETIRKILLVEGDSGADDRRIEMLVRTLKACFDTSNKLSATDYQSVVNQLVQIEQAHTHMQLVFSANQREQQEYDMIDTQIDGKIEDCAQKIEKCKRLLIKARKIRKDRYEYNNLANIICEQPSRQKSLKELAEKNEKIDALKQKSAELDQKMETHRKCAYLFATGLHQLKESLTSSSSIEEEIDFSFPKITAEETSESSACQSVSHLSSLSAHNPASHQSTKSKRGGAEHRESGGGGSQKRSKRETTATTPIKIEDGDDQDDDEAIFVKPQPKKSKI